jgi:UDP-N-acetylmuramoyl-L-alanyl-D-glutamate--2,6-diaminopimelate ligase
MKLRELMAKVPALTLQADALSAALAAALEGEVKGLTTNSQACQPGDVFIGMPGTRVDGGDFWAGALAAGALAAVVSPTAYAKAIAAQSGGAPSLLSASDMSEACAQLSAAFFDFPAQSLNMVGVTGTNGKTTTTYLIEHLLQQTQRSTALFGTLFTRWPGFEQTATHTTPFAVDLQRQLAQARTAGAEFATLEVSSHALHQGRVLGCPFEAAVFTNLTQDHLDYHPSMEDYFEAKALLFSPQYLQGRAILNIDDAYGQRLAERVPAEQRWTYSLTDSAADLWPSDLTYGPTGVSGTLNTPKGQVAFQSPLVGQFNLANVLGAVGAALHLGLDLEAIAAALPGFTGVPGRMEQVIVKPDQDISVIVDYAHTPDSLQNLLTAARPFIAGQVVCVFGCGGDRDRTKRPQMGKIAADLADVVIVTSDNPRTEDPERILQDVVAGIPAEVGKTVLADRASAIRQAIAQAQPGDGVLIAGKGHEDYQILGTEKIHFDDREQAREALAVRYGG